MPQTIPVFKGGKLYQMPWAGVNQPTDNDIDTFLSTQVEAPKPKTRGLIPRLAKSYFENKQGFDEASLEFLKGGAEFASKVLKDPTEIVKTPARAGLQGIKDVKAAYQDPTLNYHPYLKGLEVAGKVGAIPLEMLGGAPNQIAEDLIKGEYGKSLVHGGMTLGAGFGAKGLAKTASSLRRPSGPLNVTNVPQRIRAENRMLPAASGIQEVGTIPYKTQRYVEPTENPDITAARFISEPGGSVVDSSQNYGIPPTVAARMGEGTSGIYSLPIPYQYKSPTPIHHGGYGEPLQVPGSIVPTTENLLSSEQNSYQHPQVTSSKYGIVPRNIHDVDPILGTVPNRIQPPGANQAVFEALVPDNLGTGSRYKSPDSRSITSSPIQEVQSITESPKPVEQRTQPLSEAELKNAEIVKAAIEARKAKVIPPKVEVPQSQTPTPEIDFTEAIEASKFRSKRLQNDPGLLERLGLKLKDETGAIGPDISVDIEKNKIDPNKGIFGNQKGSIPLPTKKGKTPLEVENRKAFEDFVNQKTAADYRGGQFSKDNPDLKDLGLQGILDYQKGNRTGPLQKVQDFFNTRHSQAVEADILNEDQFKENYLRQLWKESPEEVSRVMKNIPKTPGFAKHSIIKDYQAGIKAGLTPKYENIADIMGIYEAEHGKALATKELYNYLADTGQIKTLPKGESVGINNFNRWVFKGPHHAELGKMAERTLPSERPLKNTADVVSWTKNLYLSGGIPGTQLNMHGINILKSDFPARGAIKSLKSFFDGTFTPSKDRAFLEANKDMIPKLIEHGYEPGIEGHDIKGRAPVPLDEFLSKSGPGRVVKGGIELGQRLFEDPLFKVHLPATKLQFAMERIKTLQKEGLSTEQAMRQASEDANIIYGGINKALRNKTVGDLARIGLLAPDWLESRMRFAGKKVSATARTITGNAKPGDSLYTKAATRTVGTDLLSKGVKIYAGKSIYDMLTKDKPSQITNVPAGETSDHKKIRQIPVFGTSAEELKIPQEVLASLAQRDPGYVWDFLKNKTSLPARSAMNLIENVDYAGNPLRKADRYGHPISFGKASLNIANEATAAFKPQFATALADYYSGKISKEEAIAQGLELPVQYTTKPKVKSRSPYR